MRKIIYILMIGILVSCSLDLPIEDEITGLDVIDNVAVANEALSGAYLAFPKNQSVFSVLSDDFYPNHNIYSKRDAYGLYQWQYSEYILLSNYRWNDYYNTIAKLNLLINRIPEIKTHSKAEKKELLYIKAQALALKAYSYFYLIQLYAQPYNETTKNSLGIILKDIVDAQELPRTTLEESYVATEKLLLEAISLFEKEPSETLRLSAKSSKGILAKLYLNWKKYDKAIALCDELINNNNISKDNYIHSWKDPNNNPEVLLAFENELFYFEDLYNESQQEMFYCNRKINFSTTDYRKPITFLPQKFNMLGGAIITANYIGKYRTNLKYREGSSILAIREAEFYFIKAEAQYHLVQKDKAKSTLNTILSLRGADLIPPHKSLSLKDLLLAKQKEFLGEGLRFFDLKRNKMGVERVSYTENKFLMEIQPDDFRWVLPIPYNEVKQNKNAKQNPKWDNYVY